MCMRCSCPFWKEIWHEVHKWFVDGSREGDCSARLSALVPRLEDVALSIASVMTREEKDQLKVFVTIMVN